MQLNIRDSINFASKLSIKRSLNISKVYASYFVSKWRKKGTHWGFPFAMAIEPTTSCNLRCPECPSGLRAFSRPTGMLEPDSFKKIIDQVKDSLIYLTFYFQGEPYLNPHFFNLVKYATDRKIYTATSTNAHFLTPENAKKTINSGLDRLIISIDGTTQEVYQQYRIGGKLKKVLEGTRNIVAAKKKAGKGPHIIFQFLVVKPNEHQIEEVKAIAKEYGVDEVKFKTAQVYEYKNGNPLIPTIDKYSRYSEQSNGSFEIKNNLSNQCWKMWHSCVVTWDGNVVPCCFDKDASHPMGDLKVMSFKDVWQGQTYKGFRDKVLLSRSQIDICKNCTEGTKVWA
jgi:radical SAM protein with 4Fe4S-binding SPASM domain